MAVFYVVGCVILIVVHADRLPATIATIVGSAFSGQAAVGGFGGPDHRLSGARPQARANWAKRPATSRSPQPARIMAAAT
jgi:AGCS family alanine or glycine:cation symporter